jgi:integrase
MVKGKRITKKFVDSVKANGTMQLYWDADIRGFGFRVTPKGARSYVLQYRFKGQSHRVTLGQHGPMTPEQARVEATRRLGDIANGIDPMAIRRAEHGAPMVGDLLRIYLDEVGKKKASRTADEYSRYFGVNEEKRPRSTTPPLAAILRHKVGDVTREQMAKIHTELHETPYLANRALAAASTFFSWCEKTGYRTIGTNPCRAIERYDEQGRERFLSIEELTRVGKALLSAEEKGMSATQIAALRFLTLTGFREQEALTLKWTDIDDERGTATLAQSKTGRSVRHLGAAARELLTTLPREADNPHVFPGKAVGSHLTAVERLWRYVKSDAKLEGVRLHDLRHSFASFAVSGGMSLPLVGALLGHKLPTTTAKYAHIGADPRRLAAEKVSSEIDAALRGHASAEVIPIKKANQ